jgi:hypothetical protein
MSFKIQQKPQCEVDIGRVLGGLFSKPTGSSLLTLDKGRGVQGGFFGTYHRSGIHFSLLTPLLQKKLHTFSMSMLSPKKAHSYAFHE